jgi:hypothetical protein
MAPKGDNVVVSNMKLERMLSMKGGKGEASYANNSQAQVYFLSSYLFFLFFFFSLLYLSLSLDSHTHTDLLISDCGFSDQRKMNMIICVRVCIYI